MPWRCSHAHALRVRHQAHDNLYWAAAASPGPSAVAHAPPPRSDFALRPSNRRPPICAGWIVIVIKCWALTFVLSTLDAARYGWPCRVRRASLQLSTLSVEPQIIARWAEYLRRHLQVAREWTKAAIAQHRLLDTQLILTPSSVNDAMYSCMFAARSASIMKLSAIAVVAMVLGGWEEILRLWPSLGF
jgi:hypothetical protein